MAFIGIEGFLISLAISSIIIYVATKLLEEEEGFGTAALAALSGAALFTAVSYFVGTSWVATIVGGIAWLIALGTLYNIGWLKSFAIALVIWLLATVTSRILPTIAGPL